MEFWSEICRDCLSYLGVSKYVKVLLFQPVECMDILLGTKKNNKKKIKKVTFLVTWPIKKFFSTFYHYVLKLLSLRKKGWKFEIKWVNIKEFWRFWNRAVDILIFAPVLKGLKVAGPLKKSIKCRGQQENNTITVSFSRVLVKLRSY